VADGAPGNQKVSTPEPADADLWPVNMSNMICI
jgi:hypothetical protein